MALIPVHLRAEEIWSESGCNASSITIAARLTGEGYGDVKPATVRSWKKRHAWSSPAARVISAVDDAAVASFEDVARALRHVGQRTAEKLTDFVDSFQPTEIAQAESLVRIMCESISVAAKLDEGVLTRIRIDRERNEKTVKPDAGAVGKPMSHVNAVVAMFDKASRHK
jgi:hypothetical protein